jgi:hypothetical protein
MSDSAYSYCENFEKQEKCLFIYLTRTKDSWTFKYVSSLNLQNIRQIIKKGANNNLTMDTIIRRAILSDRSSICGTLKNIW